MYGFFKFQRGKGAVLPGMSKKVMLFIGVSALYSALRCGATINLLSK
jgi:hypothetical protein